MDLAENGYYQEAIEYAQKIKNQNLVFEIKYLEAKSYEESDLQTAINKYIALSDEYDVATERLESIKSSVGKAGVYKCTSVIEKDSWDTGPDLIVNVSYNGGYPKYTVEWISTILECKPGKTL